MGQPGVGRPGNTVTRIPHPQAEVHIVERHGELFVQPADFVPDTGFYQQAGTGHGGEVLHRGGAEQIAAAARLLVLVAVARVAAQPRDHARVLERLVRVVEHGTADGRPAGVRDAGYRVAWTPYARLTHYESKSRGGDEKDPAKAARFASEQQRLYAIHGKEKILDDPYYNPSLTRDREDFSESDDLRKLKEGKLCVRFLAG